MNFEDDKKKKKGERKKVVVVSVDAESNDNLEHAKMSLDKARRKRRVLDAISNPKPLNYKF